MKLLSSVRWRSLGICLLASVLTYVGLTRLSPPFESRSIVVLQEGFKGGALSGSSLGVAALFADVAGNSNLRMLRQVLQSDDTVKELDAKLGFIAYYAEHGNFYERFLADKDDPARRVALLEHLLQPDIDDRAGLMVLSVRAYDPAYAQNLNRQMVEVAQRRMNELAQLAAREQIQFLERETRRLGDEDAKVQQKLQDYQARSGLTAAEIGVALGSSGVAAAGPEVLVGWQQKLAELQVKRGALRQFLREDAPEVKALDAEIAAVEGQIAQRKRALLPSASGKGLSQARIDFANLMYEAGLSKEMYLGAIRATTQARAEASRTLKRVDMVQAPTLPLRSENGSTLVNLFWAALVGALVWNILGQIKRYVQSHND